MGYAKSNIQPTTNIKLLLKSTDKQRFLENFENFCWQRLALYDKI